MPLVKITAKPPLRDIRGRFQVATNTAMVRALEEMRLVGRETRDLIRAEVPGSGELAKYIGYEVAVRQRAIHLEITAARPRRPYPELIFEYIRRGTRAHEILPVKAKALRFFWDKIGEVVFLRRVWHPGTRPDDFVERVMRRATVRNYVRGAGQKVVSQVKISIVGGRRR